MKPMNKPSVMGKDHDPRFAKPGTYYFRSRRAAVTWKEKVPKNLETEKGFDNERGEYFVKVVDPAQPIFDPSVWHQHIIDYARRQGILP